jgi:uncharacterized protein YdhG (YjbR/CyaY superfamily)
MYRDSVPSSDVDAYLAHVPSPQRETLESLRRTLRGLLPDAEEGISYGVPCFKVGGQGIAGFASYRGHCSYLPMSGSVLATLADEVAEYKTSKGALKFAIDQTLPDALVRTLVSARQAEVASSASSAKNRKP